MLRRILGSDGLAMALITLPAHCTHRHDPAMLEVADQDVAMIRVFLNAHAGQTMPEEKIECILETLLTVCKSHGACDASLTDLARSVSYPLDS